MKNPEREGNAPRLRSYQRDYSERVVELLPGVLFQLCGDRHVLGTLENLRVDDAHVTQASMQILCF